MLVAIPSWNGNDSSFDFFRDFRVLRGENMIPRIRFAHLPTPIESMPRLEKALNGPDRPRLWRQ